MPTSSVLMDLTLEQIKEAFEKARAEVNIPGVRLELITKEYYGKAIEFAREHFMPKEPLSNAFGVEWSDELKMVWAEVLKMNLSIMFLDENTGDMIAFRTIRIATKDEKFDPKMFQSQTLRDLIEYTNYCEEKADFFGHYGITEAFNFLALAVNERYKRRGYATQIVQAAISMIRHFGFDTVYIKGEGSSNYSKKIYEKMGFETLYEDLYETWEVDGKRRILNTGEHKSVKAYGLKVTQNK